MKKIVLFIAIMFGVGMLTNAQNLPDNPADNSCYVKCIVPDTYKTETVKVMVRAAYKKITVVPATYKTVDERVMTKEASVRYEIVPATYKNETMSYVSKAGYNRLAVTPASFSDASETVETYPTVKRWESQDYVGCESDNPADCQVWCWRAHDAQSTTLATKALTSDAGTTATPVAAKNGSYTRRVIDRKAEVKEIPVEAEYKTIKKTVLDTDETTTTVNVEAEYQTITKTVLDTKGSPAAYVQIDCELLEYNVLPINFSSGSATLSSSSKSTVSSKIFKLMSDKPGTRVEIGAHTDSRGGNAANKRLSERRAQSVVNYLISKGIAASRLVAVGYGEDRLKNKCSDGVSCSDSEHAVNRRVEFRVLNQ